MDANNGAKVRRIDPELAALRVLVPRINIEQPADARQVDQILSRDMNGDIEFTGVTVEDRSIPRVDGTHLAIRIYAPVGVRAATRPVVLFLHGGCFVLGGLFSEAARCVIYARETNSIVVAVDYRLAPENPFPAGYEDCRDALTWIRESAAVERFDLTRIAVGGVSAGGALAAAVALGDEASEPLRLLVLLYPVLDGRADTDSIAEFVVNPVLDSKTVLSMWHAYLGSAWRPGQHDLPPLASPAHASSISSLPPTFIAAAELDPLRDEAMSFAERLKRDGVPVNFRFYPDVFHCFDSFVATRMAQTAIRHQVAALREAFSGPAEGRG